MAALTDELVAHNAPLLGHDRPTMLHPGDPVELPTIATSTPNLRREQIIFQVALLNTLMHVKGYGAPETKAAGAQVRALIEQAERLGETPDDPSLLLSALFGQWIVNFINFNGDVARELARHAAGVRDVRNPILAARAVLRSDHVLLCGEGASAFARANGVATCDPNDLGQMPPDW